MPGTQQPLHILKDLVKHGKGIHVDADYLYAWGPGYIPEGYSYPIDTVFIYNKHESFELDGMLVGFGQDIYCVASTDNRIIVGGGGGKDLTGYRYSVLRLYNRETQLLEQDWGGDEYRVTSLFVDEKHVYAGTSDSELLIHDKDTMRQVKSLYRFPDQTAGKHIAVDGSWLYGGTMDGAILAWNKATFDQAASLKAGSSLVTHVITRDGIVYAADESGTIYSWKASTRTQLASARVSNGWVRGLVVHGQHVFTGDKTGKISAWNADDFQNVLSFSSGDGAITGLLADERYLYTSKDDGAVQVWNIADVLSNIKR